VPRFKGGVSVNKCNDDTRRYLRITAGPQRGRYVHDLILEAKLGRPLKSDETAEHKDGNGLNVDPTNIIGPVSRSENSRLKWARRKAS
jgi:hypothetical protein